MLLYALPAPGGRCQMLDVSNSSRSRHVLVLLPEDLAWMLRLRCLRFLSVTTTDEGTSWPVLCILGLMLPGLLFAWGGRPHWGWQTDKALLPGG